MSLYGNANTFADAINKAQELPNAADQNKEPPSLFNFSSYATEQFTSQKPDSGKIQSIPKYNFKSKIARFVIGPLMIGTDRESGEYLFEDKDDSEKYEELMNEVLAGKYILRFEEKHFTKEGALIIYVSWLIPLKKEAKSKE